MSQEFNNSLQNVFNWARKKNFCGHDPHDLLESPFLRFTKSVNAPWLRLGLLQIGRRAPINLHQLFRVKEEENPKGIALFLSGLVKAKEQAASDWLPLANNLASRLLADKNGSPRRSWGYPFAWQSRTHFLHRDAPSIVTTSFVGQALLDLYDVTHDASLIEAVEGVVCYIIDNVPTVSSEHGIAFGYGANDPQIVFNASLLGADLIARTGRLTNNESWLELAKSAARFVVHYQQPDGSWYYGLEPSQTWIDSFHTGYVLTSLKHITDITNDHSSEAAIQKGYTFFKEHCFMPDGAPKYFANKAYPLDAHTAAQAILTLIEFGDLEFAERVAHWAIQNLQSHEGYFYYQIMPWYKNRVPYMRWSNAWMFRALAELVSEG